MGYSALLFCPDDKTARTVTQVLSELEFAVVACTEPFAAVKKLMGQHLDAVVVDCDNEQNATLLFKSARNSTSNQTSLAVAVVEGQAGVAKAFRIGANLVLTKPINIEQSKGTLRVARGLLRKSEPAKGVGTASSSPNSEQPQVAKAPASQKTMPPAVAPLTAENTAQLAVKPTPAWPLAAAATASASTKDEDLLGIESGEAKPIVAAAGTRPTLALNPAPASATSGQVVSSGGAAAAAAPARELEPRNIEKTADITASTTTPEKAAERIDPAPSVAGAVPSFSFGGMNDQAQSESGGSAKKITIGIAAALVLAGGLYAGISHFRGSDGQPAKDDVAASEPSTKVSQPAPNTGKTSVRAEKPSANLAAGSHAGTTEPNKVQQIIDETAGDRHSKTEATPKKTSADEPDVSEEKPEAEPLLVKSGKLTTRPKQAAEAPAPSLIGIANPNASAPPAGLVPSTASTLRPTLSSVNVSQGVSTGLLMKKVAPSYPASALRMQIEGDVELLATISKDGNITHIQILSGSSQLTKAAADAVKQWKYKPYLLNGEPVEIQTQVTVRFKLPH
jgi:TonB family protein